MNGWNQCDAKNQKKTNAVSFRMLFCFFTSILIEIFREIIMYLNGIVWP